MDTDALMEEYRSANYQLRLQRENLKVIYGSIYKDLYWL